MFTATNCATDFSAVTPSDTTDVGFTALYIGVSGNVVIQNKAGTSITFANVPVGFFPVSGDKVMAATTASSILALR